MATRSKKAKATRRRRVTVHKNPTTTTRTRTRRRVRRNPSGFSFGPKGGVLGELLSKEGLMMVGGAFVAPMVADFVQEKIMPNASGWMKIAVKAAVVAGGAWAIDKFLKQRKAAIAFGVTGAAVLAADGMRLYRGQLAGLSEGEADYLATRPELMGAYVGNGMSDNWQVGMGDQYKTGLADAFSPAFG